MFDQSFKKQLFVPYALWKKFVSCLIEIKPNNMNRRKFLQSSGLALGASSLIPTAISSCTSETSAAATIGSGSWEGIRALFDLDYSHLQMSQMLLASHPKPVREAINKHRDAYNANPATYWEEHWLEAEKIVARSAAKYMNVDPGEIALTDSTTMGTSLLLNGMKLKPGDEILATTHDHYVSDKAIDFVCEKTGTTVRRIDEYKDPATITVDEVVHNISKEISDKTRVLMVTWVQSCTGVKLPIRAISELVKKANASRSPEKRIYFAVDGVHGFGNQDEDISGLGCDFFSAGTHKWLFGPRGTGILYGKRDAWDFVRPTIPPFSWNPYVTWMGLPTEGETTFADLMTPGGFHAFDHRWALNSAFDFQMEMGRKNVHMRTTELSTKLKDGIRQIKNVKLYTPVDPELSAGINCFMVGNLGADEIVSEFHKLGVIASSSPYLVSYARLTPCVINTEEEVEQSLSKLEEIASKAKT